MSKFLDYLGGALAVFLIFFGPPLAIYALVMFGTWGGYWNPGDWESGTRGLIAILWGMYALMMMGLLAS